MMTAWWKDLRLAGRMLRKNPGFTLLIVLTLGLGIGANTAIFSAVDAVLFRPLAVRDPGSLVRVWGKDLEGMDFANSSFPVYTDYRDAATSFEALAAYDDAEFFHVSTGGQPERLTGAVVSGNYFDLLGARAERGRLLTASDDGAAGAHPVAVVSDRLWRTRFGADPAAIGATARINGHPFTIVGVAPKGFTGVSLDSLPDVWVPIAMADQALPELAENGALRARDLSWLDVVGRLKPGVTLEKAQAELDAIANRRAASQSKDRRDPMARVLGAGDFAIGPGWREEARRLSWLLLGMAGVVLLIACADAAGLLLVRSQQRRREIAVRLAVGASRAQIAQQLFAESLLLAGLGTGGGLLLSVWAADLLAAAVPADFRIPIAAATPTLDPRALAFAATAAVAATLVFGLAPALSAGRSDVLHSLKGTAAAANPRRGAKDALVVAQIALTAVLLVGAGLTARTLSREARVNPGFDPRGKLEASVDLARQGYDRQRGSAFLVRLLARVAEIPGVRAAALARTTPVQSAGMITTIESDGYAPASGEIPRADLNIVTPGFFRTLGARVLAGRDFDTRDTATSPAVAIISESMARKYWPGRSAIGRRILNLGPPGVGGEVVGIVSDVHFRSLRRRPDPTVYVPASQFYTPRTTILLDAGTNADALREPLVRAVAELDPALPLFQVRTLSGKLELSLGQSRLLALLVAAFGGLALLLAAAGLYGVVSHATQIRTREFGIRMALGARAGDVGRLVLARSARLAGLGLGLGIAIAAVASRALVSLLFGVSPLDPLSYAAAALLLAATALAAGSFPARRATRVDPMTALRSE